MRPIQQRNSELLPGPLHIMCRQPRGAGALSRLSKHRQPGDSDSRPFKLAGGGAAALRGSGRRPPGQWEYLADLGDHLANIFLAYKSYNKTVKLMNLNLTVITQHIIQIMWALQSVRTCDLFKDASVDMVIFLGDSARFMSRESSQNVGLTDNGCRQRRKEACIFYRRNCHCYGRGFEFHVHNVQWHSKLPGMWT